MTLTELIMILTLFIPYSASHKVRVQIKVLLLLLRIIDNMPVTWCYDVADETSGFCSTGFPIGCHVSEDGQARDACVTSVSFLMLYLLEIHTSQLSQLNCPDCGASKHKKSDNSRSADIL